MFDHSLEAIARGSGGPLTVTSLQAALHAALPGLSNPSLDGREDTAADHPTTHRPSGQAHPGLVSFFFSLAYEVPHSQIWPTRLVVQHIWGSFMAVYGFFSSVLLLKGIVLFKSIGDHWCNQIPVLHLFPPRSGLGLRSHYQLVVAPHLCNRKCPSLLKREHMAHIALAVRAESRYHPGP